MNIELAKQVLDFVSQHPEKHNQLWWMGREDSYDHNDDVNVCGTTGCIAGWTVIFATGKATLREACRDLGHGTFDTDAAAAEALGIDRGVADDIFYTNDRERAIEKFAALIEREST